MKYLINIYVFYIENQKISIFALILGKEMNKNLNYYSLCKKEMEKRNIL